MRLIPPVAVAVKLAGREFRGMLYLGTSFHSFNLFKARALVDFLYILSFENTLRS